MHTIEQLKSRFLGRTNGNFIKASLIARGSYRVYKVSCSNSERLAFRNYWRGQVTLLGKQYKKKMSEKKHCQNIENLSDVLSEKYGEILNGDNLCIGRAQKSLNLHLKYEWCRGNIIQIPPHCTVDRTILQKVGIHDAWTKCDSIEEYKYWMERLKEKAGEKELAEWELQAWLDVWG